jgi:hypothetical protein
MSEVENCCGSSAMTVQETRGSRKPAIGSHCQAMISEDCNRLRSPNVCPVVIYEMCRTVSE